MANIHPLPLSWYLISLQWVYLCSSMHIMSTLWSIADAVSSGSCPILFKVLTLNVTVCIVRLHFGNFCFSLSSVADFSNTEARAPNSAKIDGVWTGGVSVGHYNFSMAVFILIYRSHPYSMSSSSSTIELFDPGRWTVGFIRPGPGYTWRWTVRGFVRSLLRPSCCFPWLSKKNFFPPLLPVLSFN